MPSTLKRHIRSAPLSLRFPDKFEREYQQYLYRTFIGHIRMSMLLALVLYAAFGVLDYYMVPDIRHRLWFLRYAIVCPVLIAHLGCSVLKGFERHYQWATGLTSFVGMGGILAMLLMVPSPVDATYSAGLVLTLFFTYGVLRLSPLLAAFLGWLMVVGYLVSLFFITTEQWVVINNSFFLISANLLGMFASYFTDRHARDSFLYMRLHTQEQEKNTEIKRRLVREVADRRKNELRLANSERSLRNVFNAVDGALLILDNLGEVLDVNRKMLKMFEAKREQVVGVAGKSQFSSQDTPYQELRDHFYRALEGKPVRFEWKGRRIKSGQDFHLEVSMTRVRIDGRLRVLATAHDITDRKRAEGLREDMERLSRHDLKAPLNSILAFPDIIMEERDDLSDDEKHMLMAIESAGYRMLDMINRSQTLYKLEAGTYDFTPGAVDLLAVARKGAEDVLATGRDRARQITFTMGGKTPADGQRLLVPGEELLLYSMIANLLKNAVEASDADEPVQVALDAESDVVRLTVINTGEVPEEFRPIFFEKYATTGKAGGSGLGTYSARLIAKVHGGLVKLNASKPGRTSVVVLLPVQP